MRTKKRTKARLCAMVGMALVAFWVVSAVLTACSPRPLAASGADGSSSATAQATWSVGSDCATCHERQCSSAADDGTLGTFHEALGNDCFTCHDADNMAGVHEEHGDSGRTPTKLRYSEVADEQCLSCHGSYEALAEKTTSSTDLVDTNGKVANPHDLPQSPIAGEGHDTITCVSCHSAHEQAACVEQAADTCRGCHHTGVFECGTCHQ